MQAKQNTLVPFLLQEKVEDFRRGQQEVGVALLRAAAVVLAPEQAAHLQHGAGNGEFGIRLAETMVDWGQKHVGVLEPQNRNAFLQEASCRHVCTLWSVWTRSAVHMCWCKQLGHQLAFASDHANVHAS